MSPVIVRTRKDLSDVVDRWKSEGQTIGFVPTMGALHEGHLSLVKIALQNADKCVVSIFVNPTQFAPHEDFASYPRDEKADLAKLERAGVHLVYIPDVNEIYPDGPVSDVKAGPSARGLESDFRPHFFDGVCSVVYRLFDHVKPDVAVFGEKDYQQLMVIIEMVKEKDLPIRIIAGPILRDEEGLALSSRNAYLSAEDLKTARQLNRILFETVLQIRLQGGEPLNQARNQLLHAGFSEVQYLEIRNGRLLAAVKLGNVRLIDNVEIHAMYASGKKSMVARYIGAIFISPAIGSLITALLSVPLLTPLPPDPLKYIEFSLMVAFIGGGMFAYPTMFLIGVPVMFIYALCRIRNYPAFAIAGILASLTCMMVAGGRVDAVIVFLFSLAGLICGSLAWAFLYFRRNKKGGL